MGATEWHRLLSQAAECPYVHHDAREQAHPAEDLQSGRGAV